MIVAIDSRKNWEQNAGYNNMERPVENATDALVVHIKFFLQQVGTGSCFIHGNNDVL